MRPTERFTVIIPTLQRSHRLHPLVDKYARHPLVGEILVVNNSSTPLTWRNGKVRVLQQSGNIFVNPAWNLGARHAGYRWLLFSNDDIDFSDGMLEFAATLLHSGRVGIVGPSPSAFIDSAPKHRMRASTAYERSYGYGTWMALSRDDYAPIPEDLLIWCGDDWLFYSQSRKNVQLHGCRIVTEMSTSIKSERLLSMAEADLRRYEQEYREIEDLYRARYRIQLSLQRRIDLCRKLISKRRTRPH